MRECLAVERIKTETINVDSDDSFIVSDDWRIMTNNSETINVDSDNWRIMVFTITSN